jgi:hypothetical protein
MEWYVVSPGDMVGTDKSQEIKLFQLTNSLIDVLTFVPSLAKAYDGTDWGPQHAVVDLHNLLGIVAGGKSERLDKLHMRMAQMNLTPSPRRALLEHESDEGTPRSSESDGPSAVDEMLGCDDADNFSGCQTGCHWPDTMPRDHAMQRVEAADFSEFFPEFDSVPFSPGSGNNCAGDGGHDIYGLSAGFLALGSHISPSGVFTSSIRNMAM